MGKKSGPPAPPPPPDYTKEREQEVKDTNEQRERTADVYNRAVDFYNTGLRDRGSKLTSFEDAISGLSLGDDFDNISLGDGEDAFSLGDFENQLKQKQRNFEAFSTGDVSFLGDYDPYSIVEDNKASFNQALADWKETNADAIARKQEADRLAEEQRQKDYVTYGIDPDAPWAAYELASAKGEDFFSLNDYDFRGMNDFSEARGFVDPLTGEYIGGIASTTWNDATGVLDQNYGGRDFGKAALDRELRNIGLDLDDLTSANILSSRPEFSETGTSYGQAVSYDNPTLNELNTGAAQRYLNQITDIQEAIDALQAQEAAELGRIDDFFGNYINMANQGDLDVEFADINDDFDRYAREIAQARADIAGFDSVLDEDARRAEALAQIQELEDLVSGRTAEKAAEQRRIEELLSGVADDPTTEIDESTLGVRGNIDRLRDILTQSGIADIDSARGDELLQEILAQESALRGFESDLNTNFGNEFADIYDLEDELAALTRARSQEEGRLSELTRDFTNRSGYLDRIADRTERYNLADIEDLEDAIAALQFEIGGTTSDLTTDFSGATGRLGEAQAALDALRAERQADLAAIQAQVGDTLGGLDDIAEYDEAGFMNLRSDIESQLADLARYQGGTDATSTAIPDAISQVDERLRNLGGLRGDIESDALAALQDIRNREYFTMDDVEAAQGEIEALRQRMETYGAQQAADELQALSDVMSDQTYRLSEDAANVAAREARGAAEIEALKDQYGNLRFPSVGDGQAIQTEEQLRAYLANLEEDDELVNLLNSDSSFAANLMRGV